MSQRIKYVKKNILEGHIGDVDPNSVFLGLPLFRSHGIFLYDREKYKDALARFDEALFMAPEDKQSRTWRASTYVKMQQYEEALKDAEELLRLDPSNLNALYNKAEALHLMSEFEQALMFNHRGLKLRTKPPVFEDGVLAGNETIEDCVGRNVGSVILDQIDTIKEMERRRQKRLLEEHRPHVRKRSIKSEERVITPSMQWKLKLIERQTWTRYLGAFFAEDYYFLKDFMNNAEAILGQKKRQEQILTIAEECCSKLNKTKEILRDRKPFYSYTYTDPNLRRALKHRKKIAMKNQMKVAKNLTLGMVNKLLELDKKKVRDLLNLALRTKDYLDRTPPGLLPNKDEYLTYIYELVATTYIDVLKFIPEKDDDRQLRQYFALPIEGSDSVDDFLKAAYSPYVDSHAAIRMLQAKVKTAETKVEQAWFHHDIALAHFLGGFGLETGRWHARKAIKSASKAEDSKWELLTRMISGKLEYKIGNFPEARKCFEEAANLAKGIGDIENVTFINECLNFLELCRGMENNLIDQREKTILSVLADESMKKEAEGIFRYIASQPSKRRMSIVPGVKHNQILARKKTNAMSTRSKISAKVSNMSNISKISAKDSIISIRSKFSARLSNHSNRSKISAKDSTWSSHSKASMANKSGAIKGTNKSLRIVINEDI